MAIKVNCFVNLQSKMVYNDGTFIMALCFFFCFHLSHDFLMLRTNNGFIPTSRNIGELIKLNLFLHVETKKIVFERNASAIGTIVGLHFAAISRSQLVSRPPFTNMVLL